MFCLKGTEKTSLNLIQGRIFGRIGAMLSNHFAVLFIL
jgi:hypothetical protein